MKKNAPHKIQPNSLKLNFALNTTRTVLNFLIPLAIFPYISRVLEPDGFGKVEFANSIVSYFVLFTALGIPTYGMREIARVRDNAAERSQSVFELSIILAFTVFLGYIAYAVIINSVAQFANQKTLFLIVAPTIFLSSFSFDWFYQGIENQSYITLRYIIVKTIQIACIFLLVKQKEHFLRYAAISVGMNSISALFNIVHLRKFVQRVPLRKLHASKHIKPVLIIFCSIIATNVYTHLDVTMVGLFCGDTNVGLYTVANRVIRIVISIVTIFSVVIIPRLENCLKNANEAEYVRYLNVSLNYILILALPFFLGIIALSSDIITIFAGTKYLDAVQTIQLLSPIIVIVGLAHFVGMEILFPRRKEYLYTISVSVAAVANAVCNMILIPRFQQNGAAIGTLVAEGLGLLLQIVFAQRYLKDTELISWNTVKYLIAALAMYFVIRLIPYINGNILLHCALCTAIAVGVYGVMLLALREKTAVLIFRSFICK
mgnify:FL=1